MENQQEIQNLINKTLQDYTQKNAYGVSLIAAHTHSGVDSARIDPLDLLGFPSVEVITATTAPTDNPPNGTIRFYYDGTNYVQWETVGGVWVGTVLYATLIRFVDNVSLTNQSADIGSTNFTDGGTAGLYRVSYTLLDTTADVTAGSVTLTIAYTDDAGATTFPSTAVPLTGVGIVRTQGSIYIRLASGNIAYSTSHTGAFGTSKYAVYLTLERLL